MVTGLQKLSFPVLSAETSHRLATQVSCFIIKCWSQACNSVFLFYHQILVTGLQLSFPVLSAGTSHKLATQVSCFIIRYWSQACDSGALFYHQKQACISSCYNALAYVSTVEDEKGRLTKHGSVLATSTLKINS